MDAELYQLAAELGRHLLREGWRITTAESCTGGGLSAAITAVPGSSAWFDCGFITYSNQAKQQMLGVGADTLAQHGAVSEATVREMACGAAQRSGSPLVVAVSGIAGPDGGTADKPVGTVWLAWQDASGRIDCRCCRFAGDREAVRRQAVKQALLELLALAGAEA